ncbi:MAG: ABC transporter ATP-binding protein/permease [Heliobacteriaceae bacterium]|jgi:ABC-type multidrug transport system fused ATPase/permease subunit|nr:ABC transporter ATP-binding protein/permease [Heliobacteriaceae bacterium]
MFLENFTSFIKNYGKGKYLQLAGFLAISFIAGGFEFVGIALVYPFILMIVSPQNVPAYVGNHSPLLVGFLVLVIFIAKNLFMIFTQFVQNKFVAGWKSDITQRFMQYYIYAPYSEIMRTSQADKLFVLNTLCTASIDNFVMRALNFMINFVIIAMVIALLLIKFPLAAVLTLVFTAASMIIQNKYFKNRTAALAENLARENHKYNTALLENITNLKELKILSAEKTFFDSYAAAENSFREIQVLHGYYSLIPPYIVEIIIVAALLLLGGMISIKNGNSTLVASFAVVGAALFRIAPALNRIQTSIININASRDFVKRINDEYQKIAGFKAYDSRPEKRLDFRQSVELRSINFAYNEEKPVIKNLSFEIKKGDFIGIIGLSGAGKSTLADIIMGLLPVQSAGGRGQSDGQSAGGQSSGIFVDGRELTPKLWPAFRNIIGYVPQEAHVLDRSFKENVAWGSAMNIEGVVKALKAARLYDFVSEFPEGIDACAIVDSHGLSHGQKQRLAIARALYRDPEILIFDEATSALDVQTENEITEMLGQFRGSKTIIAIAHRLSTLKSCNKLIYLKDGRIVDVGSFEELSARHEDFENLVKLSSI